MLATDLSNAIAAEQWDRVQQLAKSFPSQASQKVSCDGLFDGKTAAKKVLPLHLALVKGTAPFSCIKTLVQAYPNALRKQESSFQRTPLHCACRKNAEPKVVDFLVQQYKPAVLISDSLDRLPIHYALTNGSRRETLDILLQADPNQLKSADFKGWSPVAIAMSVGTARPSLVGKMLNAYPEAVLVKTHKGSSLDQVIPRNNPHHKELKQLIEKTQQEVEANVNLPSLRKNSLRQSKLVMV